MIPILADDWQKNPLKNIKKNDFIQRGSLNNYCNNPTHEHNHEHTANIICHYKNNNSQNQ